LSNLPYQGGTLKYDERFGRLILAAALPHPEYDEIPSTTGRNQKIDDWMLDSLLGIHALVGRATTYCNEMQQEDGGFSKDTLDGIQTIVDYCCHNHMYYSLERACEIFWAVKGLQARIPALKLDSSLNSICPDGRVPSLSDRVSALPFDIIPLGIDWSHITEKTSQDFICKDLIAAIPFKKDTIVTRQGKAIVERRGTAWLAAPSIGALAYSGKLMPPRPIPPIVESVMRYVEERLNLPTFFDCALCNHYSSIESACSEYF
jgi:hypothetical protein